MVKIETLISEGKITKINELRAHSFLKETVEPFISKMLILLSEVK